MRVFVKGLLATTALVAASAAQAQDFGYTGLSYTVIEGNRGDGSTDTTVTAANVDAMFTYSISDSARLAFAGTFSSHEGGADGQLADDGETFGTAGEISLHYLRDAMGGDLTYGAFLAFGSAETDADNPDETYPHNAFGFQAAYAVNSDFTVYGQVGVVDTGVGIDALNSGGYREGSVARLGAAYSGFQNTVLYLDLESGRAMDYEDAGENGVFSQVAFGGETSIGGGPWAITYEASMEVYDSVPEDNTVEINTVSLGVRYHFGGGTGSALDAGFIGTPDIMSRASLVTGGLD